MLLSPNDILSKGLKYVGVSLETQGRKSEFNKRENFKSNFGSTPLVIADIWYDLQHAGIPGAGLSAREDSEKGLKAFMMAIYFLWIYPKNARILSGRFGICERYCRGDELWRWVYKIQALKQRKIKWDPTLADPNKSAFIGSIDGTDCQIWEPKHPTMNMDKSYSSHKFKSAALKYEIILSITDSQILWISGPFKGGTHDMTCFRRGFKRIMLPLQGKMLVGDSIYKGGDNFREEHGMFAPPSPLDSEELSAWKSRVRCRQETINDRMKFFSILKQCFECTDHNKHKAAFEAVAVIVQYQMDNGAPLYTI
jgi:hypothetical protein